MSDSTARGGDGSDVNQETPDADYRTPEQQAEHRYLARMEDAQNKREAESARDRLGSTRSLQGSRDEPSFEALAQLYRHLGGQRPIPDINPSTRRSDNTNRALLPSYSRGQRSAEEDYPVTLPRTTSRRPNPRGRNYVMPDDISDEDDGPCSSLTARGSTVGRDLTNARSEEHSRGNGGPRHRRT